MLKSNMGSGISWNLVSLIFLALAGVVLSFVIVMYYSPEVNGIFGLSFAWYTAISQISVAGIHFSVLKYVSQYHEDKKEVDVIMGTAVLDTAVISLVVTALSIGVVNMLHNHIGQDMFVALMNTLPALFFFSMNKVLLNYFNGLSKMKAYAVFQSLRNLLLALSLTLLVVLKVEGVMLTLCYLLSESILFLVMSVYILAKRMIRWRLKGSWIIEHIKFGVKIIPGNLVLALNVRMDIFCLKLFVPFSIVGYYQLAGQIAEGFYQIIMVIRRNINPRITQHYEEKDFAKLDMLRHNVRKYPRLALPPIAMLLVGGVLAFCFIFDKTGYLNAVWPLAILTGSMCINSFWLCFGNALNQTGFPANEAWLNVLTLIANTALNLILIPLFGLVGGAIATATSYGVFSIILSTMLRKKTGYRLPAFAWLDK